LDQIYFCPFFIHLKKDSFWQFFVSLCGNFKIGAQQVKLSTGPFFGTGINRLVMIGSQTF
jgi:hypothetical protein